MQNGGNSAEEDQQSEHQPHQADGERRSIVNKPILSEKDAVCSVFNICDTDKTGLVKVSKLVAYIKSILWTSSSEICAFLDDLSLLLDPLGLDHLVDWDTYQQGIEQWIEDIKTTSFDPASQSFSASPHRSSFPLASVDREQDSFTNFQGKSNSWRDYESYEEVVECNRKLKEENTFLRQQADSLEESNSILQSKAFELRQLQPKYEKIFNSSRSAAKELEELRSTVNELNASTTHTRSKYLSVEKQNLSLQSEVEESRNKVSNLEIEIVELGKRNKELSVALSNQECLCDQLQQCLEENNFDIINISNNKDLQSSIVKALKSRIETLEEENQVLITDNNIIRNQLRLHDFSSDSMETNEMYASTPCQKTFPSIRKEIEISKLQVYEHIPDDEHSHLDEFSMNDDCLLNGSSSSMDNSVESEASSTAFMDKYSKNAKQIARNLKLKKKVLMIGMDQCKADKNGNISDTWDSEIFDESAVDAFADKIASLTTSRAIAEKRVASLSVILKKIKEENRLLSLSHDKTLQKLGDASSAYDDAEKRAHELQVLLNSERNRKSKTHKGVEELYQLNEELKIENAALRNEMSDFEELKSNHIDLESELASLKQQMDEMQRLVDVLEDNRSESMKKMFDQEENIATNLEDLDKQQKQFGSKKVELLGEVRAILNGEIFNHPIADGDPDKVSDPYTELKNAVANYVMSTEDRLKKASVKAQLSNDSLDGKIRMEDDDIVDSAVVSEEGMVIQTLSTSLSQEDTIAPVTVTEDIINADSSDNVDAGNEKVIPRIEVDGDLSCDETLMNEDSANNPLATVSVAPTINHDSQSTLILNLSPDGETMNMAIRNRRNGMSSTTASSSPSSTPDIEMPVVGCLPPKNLPRLITRGSVERLAPPDIVAPFSLDDQDCDRKFNSLMLAFRTEQYTLNARVDRQSRSRQLAEEDLEVHLRKLLGDLKELRLMINPAHDDKTHPIGGLERSLLAMSKIARRISSHAELHGCFLQERKSSPDMNFLVAFAERLRRDVKEAQSEELKCLSSEDIAQKKSPRVSFSGPSTDDVAEPKVTATKKHSFYDIASSLLQKHRIKRLITERTRPAKVQVEAGVQADHRSAPHLPKNQSRKMSRRASCVQRVSDTILNFMAIVFVLCFALYLFLNVKIDVHKLSKTIDDHYEFYRRMYSRDRIIA